VVLKASRIPPLFSVCLSLSLSLCVVAPSLVSFFLFLSFYFSLVAPRSKCFCNHPLERERWNLILYKIKMEALGTDISLKQTQAREREREREKQSLFFLLTSFLLTNNSFYLFYFIYFSFCQRKLKMESYNM
jgi:hypothetical protein